MFGGIPFDHFGHGGPGGGGPGGGMRGAKEKVDTEKLYQTLEVSKNADEKQIKKAYFKLSRIHHPDKGGEEHKFKEIAAAYEILSDPDKRKLYDQYGLKGVEDGAPSADGEDLFSMFFGGGNRRRAPAGPKKGPALSYPLKVSLDDIYNGKTMKLAVNRKVIVGESTKCGQCKGMGAVVRMRQLAPGMLQQVQMKCSHCKGQGHIAKTRDERKILEVHIEKGMHNGQKIQFKGMGDEIPGMAAGDIVFVVQVKEHNVFKRKVADLLVHKELSLNQALCGFAFKITHLDGRQIVIRSRPGEIISSVFNGAGNKIMPFCKLIPSEGMPSIGNPFVKGNLYIVFRVTFPTDNSLTPDQVKVLKEILPDPDMDVEYDEDEVEEVHMSQADLGQFGKGGASGGDNRAYESDEDGAQPVQCQQS
mmetsp:Transcript_5605/g.8339  ORF Transcript_5605/g.8339 Transcript_5605/m.8339 type:complete len:418 (-) Transcript_5605:1538-2791(-)|eukprot:CAMPEP_0197260582 /NCGR_PEP_ID=MMETSP1429-20130617/84108_1 /TAXON_ID=49237 /ORGANISM="Chaetoceros  sp., Strain UNC1202" /LENGTH=417 /DNA_ID=CAMNT_0042724827 /DNA_START=68 /DNA_END=1321 /DNA_ORIENTATION=+